MAAAGGGNTGMVTVLGLDAEAVERVCRDAGREGGLLVPANYNCPGQIAVSGDLETLKSATEAFKAAGAKRVLPLNVAAAFHSPAMEGARVGLKAALAETPIRRPAGRFVNNADAKEMSDPEAIRESLARQVASPVLWEQSCLRICAWGERTFYEVGPGKVCAGLMKRICPEAVVRPVGSMADIAALGDA